MRSLTLTPNLDFDRNFVIFVTKMMKIDDKFGENDKICYNLKFEILNPKISNSRSLTLNPKITKLDQKSSKIKISHGRIS